MFVNGDCSLSSNLRGMAHLFIFDLLQSPLVNMLKSSYYFGILVTSAS